MLVLSRREGESIQIGGDVRITVVRIKGSSVRLGIEAPAHTGILRSEIEFDMSSNPEVLPGKDSRVATWSETR